MTRRHLMAAVAIAIALGSAARHPASADPGLVSSLNWIFDGPVNGAARLGDTLYVGGAFTRIAPPSAAIGSLYALSEPAGAHLPAVLPKVDGTIRAIEPDGAGGYFVGGVITVPGATAPLAVIRVLPNGTVDATFPAITGSVSALQRLGDALYIAGAFVVSDGVTAPAVAIAVATGARLPWAPDLPSGFQASVLAASAAGVVVGGIETQPLLRAIGAFDPSSGARRWYASLPGDSPAIEAAVVAGSRAIIARASGLVAVDVVTGAIDAAWTPQVRDVKTLAVAGTTLYAGGSFALAANVQRPGLAAFDVATAALLPWTPQLPNGANVAQIAPAGGEVYVGGLLADLSQPRRRLARIDAAGTMTAWTPAAFADAITALRVAPSGDLLIGSSLAAVGGTPRSYLAAFDVPSGELLPWTSAVDIAIDQVVASAGVVYANASFGVAALDAVSGQFVAGPSVGAFVSTIAVHGEWLYGGQFVQPRGPTQIWRYNLATRTLDTNWIQPGFPRQIVGAGTSVFLADAGGLRRIDTETGLTIWANVSGPASVVAVSGDTVYSNVGLTSLTTHDVRTGALIASRPLGFEPVAVAVADGRLILNAAAGTTQALSMKTLAGEVIGTWDPGFVPTLTGTRGTLSVAGGALLAGGTFAKPTAPPLQGLAVLPLDGARAPSGLRVRYDGPATVLEWEPPSGASPASTAIVQGGRSPGSVEFGLPVSGTSFSAIVPAGTFYVRVASSTPSATEVSNEVVVRGGCTTAPPPPTALTWTPVGQSIRLDWAQPDAPVDRYLLEAGTARGLTNLATIPLPGSQQSYGATVPPGTYVARLRAVNACGQSAPSGEVVIGAGASDPVPAAPTGLTPTVFRFQSRLELAWTAPAGPVTGYVLEVGRTPGDASFGAFALGPATTATFNGVPRGEYVLRLRAINAAGSGPPSADVGVRFP